MNDNNSTLNAFLAEIKPTQKLWALQEEQNLLAKYKPLWRESP